MSGAYYNEIDEFAAQWLRNLIGEGLIAPGEVDTRSIEDVHPDDLRGFTQCHFFAGIGVWSYALRGAEWPDDRQVWTGSCPCQPFSAAGKRGGTADERHLWPAFFHLIDALRPAVVLGEQVASKDGLNWLDLVSADLEGAGYAFGANDICAAGVGAPHIRQRLWFVGVADAANCNGWCGERRAEAGVGSHSERRRRPASCGATGGLVDSLCARREGFFGPGDVELHGGAGALRPASEAGSLGGLGEHSDNTPIVASSTSERPRPTNGLWRDADWLLCRDGKWRPVEPGTFPLVNGASGRVGRLRAYGNAIVAEAAREFIQAVDWSLAGDMV